MKPVQAGLSGSLIGLLFGLAICLIQNIPIADAMLRMLILTFAGAWMGILLAWLNLLLPTNKPHDSEPQDTSR
ncbi:MAG: hypothetical protein Q9M31_07810 [Mariprofundus sp.]|nr:hypothetical protein [Mariprofundus sp.]